MNRGNSDIPKRRTIRLRGYNYSSEGAYFVTICTHGRVCLFGEIAAGVMMTNAAGHIVEVIWNELSERFPNIEPDEMVIVPNHVHFIVHIKAPVAVIPVGAIHELPLHELPPYELAPDELAPHELAPHELAPDARQSRRNMLLPKVVGYLKMNSAKRINKQRGTSGFPVWQRNYYERIVRNDEELTRAREYIANNPLKWDLDRENPENAPRQGQSPHDRFTP